MGEQIQALDKLHREKTGFSSAQFEVIQDYSKAAGKLTGVQFDNDMKQRVDSVLSKFNFTDYQYKMTNLATENKNKYLITIQIPYTNENALSAELTKKDLFNPTPNQGARRPASSA